MIVNVLLLHNLCWLQNGKQLKRLTKKGGITRLKTEISGYLGFTGELIKSMSIGILTLK